MWNHTFFSPPTEHTTHSWQYLAQSSQLSSLVVCQNAEAKGSVGHTDDSQVQTLVTKLVNYKSEQRGEGEFSCFGDEGMTMVHREMEGEGKEEKGIKDKEGVALWKQLGKFGWIERWTFLFLSTKMFEELLFIWFCKVSVYCLVVMPFVLTSVVKED